MKVSVIVPVYNAEIYIKDCINSVLSQTYTDFELILIDDGSSDSSGKICDEYAIKYAQIKVYHKKNGGVSSARNLGIEKSIGEWILFLDADDELYSNCLEICINTVLKDNLDVLQFMHTKSVRFKNNIYGKPLSSASFLSLRHNVCIGASFFRSELIKKNNITFPEYIKLAEDQVFVLYSILKSNRLEIIDKTLYHYRTNMVSATSSVNVKEMYNSCLYLFEFKRNNSEVSCQIDNSILFFIYSIILHDTSYDKILLQLYKNLDIHFCNRVSNSVKLFYYIAKYNVKLSFFIVRVYHRLKKILWKN